MMKYVNFKIGPFGCHSLIQIKDFCARQKTPVKRFKIWHISGKRKPNQKKIILHFALLHCATTIVLFSHW